MIGAAIFLLAFAATSAAADADSFEVYFAAGRYGDADRIARAERADAEADPGPDSVRVAAALERQLRVGSRLSRSGPGEVALGRRAVAIRERAHGASDPRITPALDLLAAALWSAGRGDEARATAERALPLLEAAGAPYDAERARCLGVLANIAMDAGDFEQAIARWTEVHELRARVHGAGSPEAAQALHSLGVAYRNAGRYLEAMSTYRQALEIRERTLGPEHPDVAWTLNNLANVYFDLGDFAQAARLHERALAIRERVLGPGHVQVALSLMNLANALERGGEAARAVALHERALAIYERVNGPWHRSVAQSLNNLALAVMELGDLPRARVLFERSVAIRDSVFGPGSEEAARSRLRLGLLLLRAGAPADAERVLREAVAANRDALGPDHPLAQDAVIALAVACLRLGRDSEALDLALAAERVTQRHLKVTAQGLDEVQALLYAENRSSGLDVALTVAAAMPRDSAIVARTWDALARSRAVVLDEMVARRRWAAASHDTLTKRLVQQVSEARDRLARLAIRGDTDSAAVARGTLAEAEKRAAEQALAEHSLAFRRELLGGGAGLGEAASALPPDAALVSFAWYSGLPRRGATDTTARVLAFVLPAGAASPRVVPLGTARDLESAVAGWLAEVREPPDPLRRARDEAACTERGRALRARLWDPLAPLLVNARRVFVVPDGILRVVPLAALPGDGGRVLAESGPLLHLLAVERDLVDVPGPSAPSGDGLLAVGGPDFGTSAAGARRSPVASTDPCELLARGLFDPLPGAAAEAVGIAGIWDDAAGTSPGRARILTGAAASESAVRAAAPGRRALHIAAHGFFVPERCPILGAGGPADPLARRDPLLRSGLVLAGANRRDSASSASDDGVLTAEEIAGLDLQSLEWAALSACETGLGLLDLNEGVFGLRRAFRTAGAGALVMSLWQVEDASTSEWMRALYRARFAKGLDAAAAARAATLEVLGARRARHAGLHPYYWAGFIAESGPPKR